MDFERDNNRTEPLQPQSSEPVPDWVRKIPSAANIPKKRSGWGIFWDQHVLKIGKSMNQVGMISMETMFLVKSVFKPIMFPVETPVLVSITDLIVAIPPKDYWEPCLEVELLLV